jgi:hypothetical protein
MIKEKVNLAHEFKKKSRRDAIGSESFFLQSLANGTREKMNFHVLHPPFGPFQKTFG